MMILQIVLGGGLFFFWLWTALLARFKGYSAVCWLFGGGIVGLVFLSRLPLAGPADPRKRSKGNLLGLALSCISVITAFLLMRLL
jgi:hypothetical protein